jgi:hypothetical protein
MQDHPLEHLHPSLADNRGPWTMGQQPCSSHSKSWQVYIWQKLKHGPHPCSPLHAWTLTLWVGPCKVPPCTIWYKRATVRTSTQPCFVSCTPQQVRCYISSYTPRLARLLINDTKSPRLKKTIQGYICHEKWDNVFYPRNISDVTLPGSPDTAVYQDHYGGHYKKKWPCM